MPRNETMIRALKIMYAVYCKAVTDYWGHIDEEDFETMKNTVNHCISLLEQEQCELDDLK